MRPPTLDETPSLRPRRRLLFACLSASFLTPFVASSTTVALADIGRDLSLEATALGWITTSYLLAASVTMLPAGRLGDIHGRRRIFLAGLLLFSAGSVLCVFASSGALLITGRGIQGVGAGMFSSGTIALLTSAHLTSERGRVLGLNVAAVFTGASVGPFVGGMLTGAFGWRSTFFMIPAISIGTALLGMLGVAGALDEEHSERFDLRGAVIYAAIVASIAYGLSTVPARLSFLFLIAGALAVFPFVSLQARTRNPLFHPGLFRNRMFARSSFAALAFFTSTISVPFVLSLYLQFVKDFSPEVTGLVLLSQPVIQAGLSPSMGRMSDRLQPRLLASTGMALTAVAIAALALIERDTSVGFIVGALILMGFARALFSSPNANAVMSSVDRSFYGIAAGTIGTMRVGGQMLGVGIVTGVLGAAGASTVAPGDYGAFIAGSRVSLIILSAICVLGTITSIARGSIDRAPVEASSLIDGGSSEAHLGA